MPRVRAPYTLDGLVRQIARPDASGVFVPVLPIGEFAKCACEYLYSKFKTHVEQVLSLTAAIDEISETYLGGEDILFADVRAEVDAENSNLRGTANLFRPLATWLNMEPIMVEGFTLGHPMVDATATQIANFTRVNALICSGNRKQGIDVLHRVCPELAAS